MTDLSLRQGTPEWKALRKKYIGGSDAPVLMLVSPYTTPHMLWEEKHGMREVEQNFAMEYGTRMEGPAREAYEKEVGVAVEPKVIFHPQNQWMLASMDGISSDGSMAVEIKNCNTEDHACARRGVTPVHYYPQLQHQLACLGLDMMHYWSYHQGEGILVEVRKDKSYIDDLCFVEYEFWKNCIEGFQTPPLCDRDYVRQDSPEQLERAARWQRVTADIKELERQQEELRKDLIESCDGRNALIGDVKLTKSVARSGVDYSLIPELIGVDLEQYRKKPITKWRLS